MEEQAPAPPITSYEKALEALDISPHQLPPDPFAPSCNQFRLRPSEEAAIFIQRYLNPPPPWGLKINLSRTFLGPEKCLKLGQKLILNRTVTYLDLSMCDLEEKMSKDFFFCIERNFTLRHLNVNGNAIRDTGAIAAAKCIGNLESLHMASNEITDIGALAIADAVRVSGKIKTLSLRSNDITIYGLYKIMDALEPSLGLMPPEVQTLIAEKESPAPPPTETLSEPPESKRASVISGGVSGRQKEDGPPNPESGAAAAVGGEGPSKRVSETPVMGEAAPHSRRATVGDAESSGKPAVEKDDKAEKGEEEEEEEIPYNETLHTLWVDYNEPFPEQVLKNLNVILSKRIPQPPPGLLKKKGKGKKKK